MMSSSPGEGRHAGSQSDIPDIDDMINANPCAKFYMQLEDCLVDSDRNWKICQPQVRALKECSTNAKKKTKAK